MSVCSLSRLLLDTLPVGYAGVEHPWLVAVCPLLGSYDRRVPSLPRLRNSKDWSCHRLYGTQMTGLVIEDNRQPLEL